MTIPGVNATIAVSILAAVGDFHRVGAPGRLVSYLGRNPRVRQSGTTSPPAMDGSPSTGGRTPAGCWSRPPGSRSAPPDPG